MGILTTLEQDAVDFLLAHGFIVAPVGVTGGLVVEDAGSALAAIGSLISALSTQSATFQTAEAAANAVQQELVNLGIEPAIMAQGVYLLEAILPMIASLYANGIVTGGVPAAFPPGGGPGPYRGR